MNTKTRDQDSAAWQRSATRNAPPARDEMKHNTRSRHVNGALIVALATVAALLLVLLMSGCASTNWNDGDPYKYNPQTGYPFIGGPFGLQMTAPVHYGKGLHT